MHERLFVALINTVTLKSKFIQKTVILMKAQIADTLTLLELLFMS